MLRLLRLGRLIVALPEFQVIGETLTRMLPAAGKLFKVLFCLCFLFATVGSALFAGKINADPRGAEIAALRTTDFYKNGYLPINFNDYPSSFVCLFCILVVNNWFVFVDGFAAVTSDSTSRIFFITFYLSGVLVLLNVVVAFILDAFLSELEKTRVTRSRSLSRSRST